MRKAQHDTLLKTILTKHIVKVSGERKKPKEKRRKIQGRRKKMYKVKEREGARRCESRLRKKLNVTDERKKKMEKGIKNVENKREL